MKKLFLLLCFFSSFVQAVDIKLAMNGIIKGHFINVDGDFTEGGKYHQPIGSGKDLYLSIEKLPEERVKVTIEITQYDNLLGRSYRIFNQIVILDEDNAYSNCLNTKSEDNCLDIAMRRVRL